MDARKLTSYVKRFVADDAGVTATEYAVMLALILLAAMGAIKAYQATVADKWLMIQQAIN